MRLVFENASNMTDNVQLCPLHSIHKSHVVNIAVHNALSQKQGRVFVVDVSR